MKIGLRTPSLKKSFRARTTGKYKRRLKRIVNPFYGKKGIGWITNPKKALYNRVYNRTSFSWRSLAKGSTNILYLLIVLPIKLMLILAWKIMKWTFIFMAFVAVCLFVALYNGIMYLAEKAINVGREDAPMDTTVNEEDERAGFIETKERENTNT